MNKLSPNFQSLNVGASMLVVLPLDPPHMTDNCSLHCRLLLALLLLPEPSVLTLSILVPRSLGSTCSLFRTMVTILQSILGKDEISCFKKTIY